MIDADELPEGWAVATIEQLCTLNPKHPSTVGDTTEVSFVPMAAVSDLEGRIVGTERRKYREVKKGYTHFADGDVIFAKITPCMENGKAASVRGLVNGLACGTTEFFVFRSRGAIDQDYLFHFIRQESFRKAARATMQSGVGQARVPKEFVLNTELPLPPLAEQQRIVAKIDELTVLSRAARAALAEVPTLLEQFRQSVLASAFRGDLTADWREKNPNAEPASVLLDRIRAERCKQWEAKYPKKKYVAPEPVDDSDLPELPEGWCWATIEECCSAIVDCPHSTPAWTLAGRICVRTTEFMPGVLDLQDAKYVSDATYQDRVSRLVPEEGDVLYSREGGILGIAVMVPPGVELCLGQRMMLLRADRCLSAALLMHWLNSPLILDRVRGFTTGSASPHLNVGEVKRFPIPLMPADEQARIVSNIKRSDVGRTLTEEMVTDAGQQLDHLDQSILAKAFRGELVPQDPGDEPASILLERIRQEREAGTNGSTPTPKRRRTKVK